MIEIAIPPLRECGACGYRGAGQWQKWSGKWYYLCQECRNYDESEVRNTITGIATQTTITFHK